jgi:hypothetical protein
MKPAQRDIALKAYRLVQKHITGDELAARLKTDPDKAADLAQIGAFINGAEKMRLSEYDYARLKVIARVMARSVALGQFYAKTSEVDFAAGKRAGWCGKFLVDLTALGFITMPAPQRITFTPAGWALVWATGLIKQNWRVPA